MGAWARTLGLKSTSSLTKVLNGEREAGPELLEKLIAYFKFNRTEENQFRNLVALSKLKDSAALKIALAESLSKSEQSKTLKRRILEIDQFELLESYLPLAVRECTRLARMSAAKLGRLFVRTSEDDIKKALQVLSRLELVKQDSLGHFVATDDHLATVHEIPSEAVQAYHQSGLGLADEKLAELDPVDRDFQSLVLLMNHAQLPEVKKKLRDFMDTLELSQASAQVNQLYQIQFQIFPLTKIFENTSNPNLKQNQEKK